MSTLHAISSTEMDEMEAERKLDKSGNGSRKPIEVIVQNDSIGPRLRRSKSISNSIESSNICCGEATAGEMNLSDGALSEGEEERLRQISGTFLMDEFRRAMNEPRRIQKLIAQAEHHPVDAWGKALLWASASGQEIFITKFMNRAPPNLKNLLLTAKDGDGFTALHRAVVAGHSEIAKVLTRRGQKSLELPVDKDAHPDDFEILHARTFEGWTALHLAVVTGNQDMVQLLIDSYSITRLPPDYRWDFSDNCWMTPLHYAVLGNFPAVIEMLIEWRVYDRFVNTRDLFMRAPVHMASCHTERAVMETLICNRKVDLNAVDCCSYTPLHWAVYVGATDTVRCLLAQSTERTVRTTEEDAEGRTVLQIAVENETLDRKVGKDIEKLLLTSSEVKDEVERLYRDRQVYVDAANAILVGAALIASVTFGGWLQPPVGSGSAQAHQALRVFWAFNSLSFFFSIATVMAGAGAVLPMEEVYIGKAVSKIRVDLAMTSFLLIVSVVLVLGAFGASGLTSLTSVPKLRENMIVTTSMGTAICTTILLWFLRRLYRIFPNWWRRILRRFVKRYQQSMKRWTGGRGLVEIQKELEAAEMRTREEMQKTEKTAKHATDHRDKPLVDLTDLALFLGKASEKESLLRQEAGYRTMDIRKEEILGRCIMAFEEAYEKARRPRSESAHHVQSRCLNMLILNNLSSRGLHYWVEDWPTSHCRAYSLTKDMDRWARIRDKVLVEKKPKLEEEIDKFHYGMMAFEDWSV